MTRKHLGLVSLLIVAALLAASLLAATQLPADVRLPVHWDLAGTPDRFAGKWVALLMPPTLGALLSLLFYFLPALEPRARNLARSRSLYAWTWAALLILCIASETVYFSSAFGWGWRTDRILVVAIGLMLVLIGNALGKSRSMYMVGIRTPWTLASEEVWIRTHRLGGKLMVLAGLAMMASPLLGLPPRLLLPLLLVLIGVVAIVPTIYSWWLWRGERGRSSG